MLSRIQLRFPFLGSNVVPAHTWDEAVARWLREHAHKRALESDRFHLEWLSRFFSGCPLTSVTKSAVHEAVRVKQSEGVRNSTVNRMLSVLRALLRRAVEEWEWLDSAPKITLLPQRTLRVRFLSHDEAVRLLQELPGHLADMAAFTLMTGLRASNVTGLRWSEVDLDRGLAWVHADESKGRKAIPVPLNRDAIAVVVRQRGKSADFVFTYQGKRVRQLSTKAWYGALRRAGIENFRWHDLRHTWASWHAQDGTPLFALQELGGWSSAEMVRRYAHLSVHHLAGYVSNVRLPGA